MARLAVVICTAAVLALAPSTLCAQHVSLAPRVGIAAGFSVYSGNADVSGVGILGRALVSLESPRSGFSADLEATYHRFTTLVQRCPACVGCRCSPEAPPPDVWSGRVGAQWHVRGAPGGIYATVGLGLYSSIRAPGTPERGAFGLDVGLGARHTGSGLFVEGRCLWVRNSDTTAWLFPVVVGYRL